LNSLYAYLLLCRHHPQTCVVAEDGEGLAGFVSAYRPPLAPEPTLFIWQVAVDGRARGRNLALAMLLQLLERTAAQHWTWLETTVTPSNAASRQVFVKLARHLGTGIAESTYFDKEDFQDQHHEPEMLIRIGPCLA
jgi:L-2,4-diaminobutyric acid acetyltransferase